MEPVLVGVQEFEPSMLSNFNYNLRLQFASINMFWFGLWLVKLAVLAFFWRLFDSVRTNARIFWWIMIGVTIATWIISVLHNAFSCQPLGSFFEFGEHDPPIHVVNAAINGFA